MKLFNLMVEGSTWPAGLFFSPADADYYNKRSDKVMVGLESTGDHIFDGHFWVSAFHGTQSLGSAPSYASMHNAEVVLEQCDAAYGVWDLLADPSMDESPSMDEFDERNRAYALECAKRISDDKSCPPTTINVEGKEIYLLCHFFE